MASHASGLVEAEVGLFAGSFCDFFGFWFGGFFLNLEFFVERVFDHFVHAGGGMKLYILPDIFGNIRNIFFVFYRDNQVGDAESVRRQNLFFESADGQDFSGQGQLSGHSEVGT